eukprot:CAMPEP_0168861850 /NCGR_PEP_ID=MMETSP0727-20121128/18134_1 /TAXON_ID=265536 /ORGANISM="Amphiprora sp., Strain CCMP467" /LENGTH=604 /DNA_ID=CAMNT_0008916875 /DNA_START=111 /DNA_END=1927 /DNA_ORIENTATION=+
MDPRKMQDYHQGRQHFLNIFEQAKQQQQQQQKHGHHSNNNVALVSLGDLGESKSVRPQETNELFAGTTECHELAAEYLQSFGVPYEVVGGNHDLEGLDEFSTDEANLQAFLKIHRKPSPQFLRAIAPKTLLVGLSSTVFRGAKYTSHEVTIDPAQIDWFEQVLHQHPAREGWKIFVASHAPPLGSGLRTLQENHVAMAVVGSTIPMLDNREGLSSWFVTIGASNAGFRDISTWDKTIWIASPFRRLTVHLNVEVVSLSKPRSCVTVHHEMDVDNHVNGFEICTVDHDNGGQVRVDASVTYRDDDEGEVGFYLHGDETASQAKSTNSVQAKKRFKVYAPNAGDATHPPDKNLVQYDEKGEIHLDTPITKQQKSWWYMACGRVLGIQKGMLIEYEPSTMAPLGLVVGADELLGKRLAIIDSCTEDDCILSFDAGIECAHCGHEYTAAAAAAASSLLEEKNTTGRLKCSHCGHVHDAREQALLLLDENDKVVVVQPNEDGSYWRKIVRNKIHRMKEQQRERMASAPVNSSEEDHDVEIVSHYGPYISTVGMAEDAGVPAFSSSADYDALAQRFEDDVQIVSHYGPYTTTSGTANETGVVGLTVEAVV